MARSLMTRVPLMIAAAVAVALLVACGTQRPADLFLVKRTGQINGANLTLLVSDDGTVSCNGGAKRSIPDGLLLEARDLAQRLPADSGYRVADRGATRPVYAFTVRFGGGSASWQDGNPRAPSTFREIGYFTRRIARETCGLPR